jgi:probable rRNA maturation factor
LLLTSDSSIRRLNRAYRGKDQTTDVLSFPSATDLEPGRPHLGEIAISLPRAERQARRAGWRLRDELALLVTHGYLHLLGYDHETDDGTMRRMEERLLRQTARVSLDSRRLPWGETPAVHTTAARAPRSRRPERKS